MLIGAITAFKIISIAIASIAWAAASGHTLADLSPIFESNIAVAGLLYTGLVTTAAALWIQSYAFEEVRYPALSEVVNCYPLYCTTVLYCTALYCTVVPDLTKAILARGIMSIAVCKYD